MTTRWFALLFLVLPAALPQTGEFRSMPVEVLHDRIQGGWAGQMIGVSYGAPTEFRVLGATNEATLPQWKPERVSNALDQDDLYVDMTFAKVLDDKGLDATTEDFAAMFRDVRYGLWHANLAARRNLKRGVPAALAGTPKFNAHANDIDFQIEADFIGLMAPGLPRAVNDIAWRAGSLINYGDGIYGGMFVGCMYAAAFFETDPRRIVEAGAACIPAQSPYGKLIADVLGWSRQFPGDWRKTWHAIEDKWARSDYCPNGARRPYNIDAKLNGAYIALGLLYGGGEFGKTIEISTRAGQDSDCNPSSAAGILGVAIGYRAIPDQWKGGVEAIADRNFRFTDFTFRSIVASTEKRAIALIERTGGRRQGDTLSIKLQRPEAARLQVWDDAGTPAERIPTTDPRWNWKGPWQPREIRDHGEVRASRISAVKGAEVSLSFEGSGVILVGPYLPTGGTADVYLDGKPEGTVDVYPDEDRAKKSETVWHRFGLAPGRHSVRLVVRGKPYPGSKGSEIHIEDAVVFRHPNPGAGK